MGRRNGESVCKYGKAKWGECVQVWEDEADKCRT